MENFKITSYIKANGIKVYTLEKSDKDIQNGKFKTQHHLQTITERTNLILICSMRVDLYKKS